MILPINYNLFVWVPCLFLSYIVVVGICRASILCHLCLMSKSLSEKRLISEHQVVVLFNQIWGLLSCSSLECVLGMGPCKFVKLKELKWGIAK